MNSCRHLTLAACGLLLLLLGACDDPASVGLDVGPRGFQGGAPVTVNLEPVAFEVTTVDDVTGNSARVLAGHVDDPDVSVIEATGYLHVSIPDTPPDDPIQKTELVLIPDYVYGDTAQTQQLDVFEMLDEWDAENRTADETLGAGIGDRIGQSAPFTPGDTLTIELSESWVNARSESLRDTSLFADNVHGFQLRAFGNAVVGYLTGESHLRVITDQDTTEYAGSKAFTSIDAKNDQTPEDRILLQDGTGRALSFSFTLPDSLQNAPISRAVLRLPTDTSLFEAASLPEGFTRPQIREVGLEGFIDDERAFAIADSLDADDVFTFSTSSNASLRQIFQEATLGRPSIERYRVTLSQAENTISPLLFYVPGTGENAPHVALTITQPDD